MTDRIGMTTSWESPEQSPDDPTVNVTELALLWLRHAALEALAITDRLPVTLGVFRALEERLVYLPDLPMTTVLQSTLKQTLCSTAIGRTLWARLFTSPGNPADPVGS